jgi:hypothetical protein
VNAPGLARAISTATDGLRAGLATAIARLIEARREILVLRSDLADRDEKIATLKEMLNRSVSP